MMYLLLRDNKQSGPYALDELKAKGLKAYDLVWVEGRSAAWRYPSEIDELKAFAPAVEEQPFDRFFKKPATAAAAATTTGTSSAPAAQPEPAIAIQTPNRRTIYVTMPGGFPREREIPLRETGPARDKTPVRESAPAPETASLRETQRATPAAAAATAAASGIGGPPRDLPPVRERIAYRKPRPEYGREPVAEILQSLPRRSSVRSGQLILLVASVLVVLSAGIFIGLSIQRDNNRYSQFASRQATDHLLPVRTVAQQLPVQHAETNPAANPPQQAGANSTAGAPAGIPAGTGLPPATSPESGSATHQAGPSGNLAAITANEQGAKIRRTSKEKAPTAKAAVPQPSAADSMNSQPVVMQREAVHRNDPGPVQPASDKESAKLALASQVSVGTNKFEVGTFGGIHNLQVTVSNRSAIPLDLVVVEISYIQANKKVYKTENLYFRDIGPGSALMLVAPRTSRGINIQYKITSINSKQLGFSEPGT